MLTSQPDPTDLNPRRWAILAVLVTSLLVVVLDNTVLNVALPTIQEELGASQEELVWAINSYTCVFAALLFTWGVLGDRYGRKRILIIGLLSFGLASLVTAYAASPLQLIVFRGLLGAAGASVLPVTLAIITVVFPPHERGKAIGLWAAAVGGAVAVGPGAGRPARGALLVGQRLPHQRADRDRWRDRDLAACAREQEPAAGPARPARGRAVGERSAVADVRDPARRRHGVLGIAGRAGPVAWRPSAGGGVRLDRVAQRPPVAGPVAVPDPQLLRAPRSCVAGLCGHVRHLDLPDLLPADRPRLLRAASRDVPAAGRSRPAARRAPQRADGRGVRSAPR